MVPQRSIAGQLVQGGGPAQRGKRSGRGSPNLRLTVVVRATWGTADMGSSPEHGQKYSLPPCRDKSPGVGGGHGKKEQRTEDLVATLLPCHHWEHKKQWTVRSRKMREGQWGVSGCHIDLLKTWVSLSFSLLPESLPRLGCFTAH